MDAGPIRIVELMTGAGTRFVVPVFQRPYSWDEENCTQLWDDILSTGRNEQHSHFTGSVVWIQDGTMSAAGITRRMLIDGQQRITTITLLLIALAHLAKSNPDKQYAFSYEEIMDLGYLVNKYKKGDDHYKLMLSQGDRDTLRSLVDNLKNDDVAIIDDSQRLLDNLAFFESRVEAIEDPNVVWAGLQRLEVVSISLTQGQDNPQLIFESMNSTGKDLSSADLIRNYVLMGQPDQDNLYLTYWRPIEVALGTSTYDKVFDNFVRAWLTVCTAPELPSKRDVYQAFKNQVRDEGYGRRKPMMALLKELQRFARYYAAIASGIEDDKELRKRLDRIRKLDATVVNPLLLSLYDDYEHNAFSYDDFLGMLGMIESFLFRRAACDVPTHGLNRWFPSLIARLNKVQDDGGNYAEALTAFLLNEAGTPRRFPTDAEFRNALKTRDAYSFRRCFYMLTRLENSHHPKNEIDFAGGTYTIEHIMPQNALAHDEWRQMLGGVSEEEFDGLVHNIGNLTLTAYNSELSDGTFEEKKARAKSGYDDDYLAISHVLKGISSWNAATISNRADDLIGRAVEIWPLPPMDEVLRKSYLTEKKTAGARRVVTFRDVFNAGLLKEGDLLVSSSPTFRGTATVTAEGAIRLENGDEFTSPSLSFINLVKRQGGSGSRNGWHCWRVGSEDGPLIDELRSKLLAGKKEDAEGERFKFRIAFWDGLYERCSEDQAFVDAFGDQTGRAENRDWWASFGIGLGNCHVEARAGKRDRYADVGIYYPQGKGYEKLFERRDEIESAYADAGADFMWSELQSNLKYRALWLRRTFDYDMQEWAEAQDWMTSMLLRMRATALAAHA